MCGSDCFSQSLVSKVRTKTIYHYIQPGRRGLKLLSHKHCSNMTLLHHHLHQHDFMFPSAPCPSNQFDCTSQELPERPIYSSVESINITPQNPCLDLLPILDCCIRTLPNPHPVSCIFLILTLSETSKLSINFDLTFCYGLNYVPPAPAIYMLKF